jgi:hypothetical protein
MADWKLRRTFDASGFNAVANHCDVKPWLLAPDGVIDLSPTILNPANYALWCDGGGFILVQHELGIYEVHSMFEPDARDHSIAAMRAGFEYMFERTNADEILTKVSDENRAALAFAKKAGFREIFRNENVVHYSLTLTDWAVAKADLEKEGEWFHDALENKKLESGSAAPIHDDCPVHNRMVGAAVLMIKAGNPAKAVGHYNKWARMAGYATINLVSVNPPTIDVVDAIVEISGGAMEIILCR